MMRWGENVCGAFENGAIWLALYQPILHLA